MAHKIFLCGGNGAGKTTLGNALSAATGYVFRDVEDYYFPLKDSDNKFSFSRSEKEVVTLLKNDLALYPDMIFASVRCHLEQEAPKLFTCVIWVQTPKEIRMKRVWNRSFQRFGSRMLEGGDLHQQEQRFFDMVKGRNEDALSRWYASLSLPKLALDGRKPTAENVKNILAFLNTMP